MAMRRSSPAKPPSAPTSSLFFALFPPAAEATEIFDTAVELRARFELTGKVTAAERLHVTLHWLGTHAGEPPEELLARLRNVASTVTSEPIELTFDKVRSFFSSSSRPFVLGMRSDNPALLALHRSLGTALHDAGIAIPAAPEIYTPHVTLLRDRKPIASQPITPVRWTAHELVLVRSLIGKSQYERLGAWPFRPREVS